MGAQDWSIGYCVNSQFTLSKQDNNGCWCGVESTLSWKSKHGNERIVRGIWVDDEIADKFRI